MPFSIRADLTGQGQDCEKQTLMANFSTTYPTQDNQVILPEQNSGFGILLSRADSPNTWLSMNTPTELGYVNGSVVESNFLASLKWLSATPKVVPVIGPHCSFHFRLDGFVVVLGVQ